MKRRLLFASAAAAAAVNGTAIPAADQSRAAVTSPPALRGAVDDSSASPMPSGGDESTGTGIAIFFEGLANAKLRSRWRRVKIVPVGM